jgi:hypothetical protein
MEERSIQITGGDMNRSNVCLAVFAAVSILLCSDAMAVQKSRPKEPVQEKLEKPGDQPGEKTITIEVPVLMMVPLKVLENTEKQGCWMRLYDQDNFQGDRFTLVGPVAMANLRGPFGQDWENKIESIETGPKGAVTIYDAEEFRGKSAQIGPDKRVPDFTEKTGLFDNFKSLRIDCS